LINIYLVRNITLQNTRQFRYLTDKKHYPSKYSSI